MLQNVFVQKPTDLFLKELPVEGLVGWHKSWFLEGVHFLCWDLQGK